MLGPGHAKICVHISEKKNGRGLYYISQICSQVSLREGEPATKPCCLDLDLLMGGFRFVAHKSSLVCNSRSKKVGVDVLTQIQKLTNVTYNFCNK